MRSVSPFRFWARAVAFAWTTLLAGLLGTVSCQSQTGPPGLSNFGQVTEHLYRGAQPSPAGLRSLQKMGVTIIVNFRDDQESAHEERAVEALGMKYLAMPWSGHREPSTPQVVQFLDLVRDNPQAKIFVHCQRGADRTGVMTGLSSSTPPPTKL